ncbi:MAG: lipoyl synthase [Phycisphaerae bacterium]
MSKGTREKPAGRLPRWMKRPIAAGGTSAAVARMLRDLGLNTVCASAQCPNLPECFSRRTATFMILGGRCTRNCRFCAVPGPPAEPVEADEPERVAAAAGRLGLRHVVITSVTRDDLDDGGAEHFARAVRAVREALPESTVEVLIPDFLGDADALQTVLRARPDVLNHNVETVARLYPQVRPEADYRRSLELLERAKGFAVGIEGRMFTKSGLMVGLGESREEVSEVLHDLRSVGCDVLTVGQYLAPSQRHAPVERFVRPEEFDAIAAEARSIGFVSVASGPLVRSSYRAESVFDEAGTANGEPHEPAE